jgi:hypothetical protein
MIVPSAVRKFPRSLGASGESSWSSSAGGVGVKSGCCLAAGAGERHVQGAAVTGCGGPADEAASFSSVHQAGGRGLLDAEALGQLSHPPGPGARTHEMEGRTIAVTAEQLHGAERDAAPAWRETPAAIL